MYVRHDIILNTIQDMAFGAGTNSLGYRFRKLYDPVSVQLLAWNLTVVRCCGFLHVSTTDQLRRRISHLTDRGRSQSMENRKGQSQESQEGVHAGTLREDVPHAYQADL